MNKPLTQEPSDAQFAAVADRVETDKSLDDIKNLGKNPAWVDSCMATANELYRKFGRRMDITGIEVDLLLRVLVSTLRR